MKKMEIFLQIKLKQSCGNMLIKLNINEISKFLKLSLELNFNINSKIFSFENYLFATKEL